MGHASRFINYKLANFDLSTDNTSLKANTCTAAINTYGIDVLVYDRAGGEAAGLSGAEFNLYGADAVDADGKLKDDATPLPTEAAVSGENGCAIIKGLDEGVYYLVQAKAPDGYVKHNKPQKVEITTEKPARTIS